MKRTEIHYRKIGKDQIKIVDFKNVAGIIDLENEFGREVYKAYAQKKPLYLKGSNGYGTPNIGISGSEFYRGIEKGAILSKETFGLLIKTMKEAGNKLNHIVRESEVSKTRTIKI